ncbi:MAG: MFS transporter [Pseudomonadales bacterium]|nr:MFS transporter [Pseudomonadales bacterium]
MGIAQAFITPSRDGLLGLVAEGDIQRKVVMVSMVQFGVQLLGFVVASFADQMGAVLILGLQFIVLTMGGIAYFRLQINFKPPAARTLHLVRHVAQSVYEGYLTVKSSSSMSMVVVQNIAVGAFFMGSYTVTIPLLIREIYQGSANEISLVNAGNVLGLITTVVFLMKMGNIQHKGRALLISQILGCFALAGGALGSGISSLVGFVYCWGMCGGISMTMSRTIMQEHAPQDQRGRMMAFYSFSFMGSGPFGALFSGYLCEWIGPLNALTVSSSLMLLVLVVVTMHSSLWDTQSSSN